MSQPMKPGAVRGARPGAGADGKAGALAAAVHRKIRLGIVAAAGVFVLAGLVLGELPTKLVVCLICLLTLQGLWRGAGELIGLVGSTLVAVLLAPVIGRGVEGVFAGVFGTEGVLNRIISIAAVGLIIVVVGTAAISFGAKRFLSRRPQLARINKYAGAGLGLIEGTILGMATLWTALALEPIAASQVAADAQPSFVTPDPAAKPSNPVAKGVVAFAGEVRDSALGGTAQATNPIEGLRLLTLANDFVAIVRDDAAFEAFINTPVMKEIKDLPSVTTALERVKADPQLGSLFKDQSVSVNSIHAVLESRTILEIFDQTTIVADLTPRMDAIIQAIAEAKAKIGKGKGGP